MFHVEAVGIKQFSLNIEVWLQGYFIISVYITKKYIKSLQD